MGELANPALPLLTSLFASKEAVATAGGVTGCIFQLGAVIGPWVAGLSIDWTLGYGLTWLLLAVAPLVGCLCLSSLYGRRTETAAQ